RDRRRGSTYRRTDHPPCGALQQTPVRQFSAPRLPARLHHAGGGRRGEGARAKDRGPRPPAPRQGIARCTGYFRGRSAWAVGARRCSRHRHQARTSLRLCQRRACRRRAAVIEKPVNNRAWLLVLPVLAFVLFSALLPMMTVVNYSLQDSMGANNFFWNGDSWFRDVLNPSTDIGARFFDALGRNLSFSFAALLIEVPLGIAVALCLPR